jgi:hypothetical protein
MREGSADMRRRVAVTLSVGGLMLAAPGCHVGRKADLVPKLDLPDAIEIVVEYKLRPDGQRTVFRVNDPSTVKAVLDDFRRAVGARAMKWMDVAICTVVRARGDRLRLDLFARKDEQEGEVLIVKAGRRYYDIRGTLLDLVRKHKGGPLL